MKNYVTNLMMVMAVGLLFIASCSTSTKYDFIKTDPEVEKLMNIYNTKVKTSPLMMNYLNAVIDSPTTLYMELVQQDCEKEILEFVKKNKSLVLRLTHMRIVILLNKAGATDNELMFVTNWITSVESKVATVAEQTQANMLLQGTASFMLYQGYTKPGGLKDETEILFHSLLK